LENWKNKTEWDIVDCIEGVVHSMNFVYMHIILFINLCSFQDLVEFI